MSATTKLEILFVNSKGNKVNDIGDINLTHTILSQPRYSMYKSDLGKRYQFNDIDTSQGGRYKVTVFSLCHRPVSRIINVKEGVTNKFTFQLPINPECVKAVSFPQFTDLPDNLRKCLDQRNLQSENDVSGKAYYEQISDIQKACLMNIYAKMQNTYFEDGSATFDMVKSIYEVRGARIYAIANPELWSKVQTSLTYKLFKKVNGSLHESPIGYGQIGSFKTNESCGNLQLTFSKRENDNQYIIDADIDEANGILHIFQVIGHILTDSDSHPYDIREILLSGPQQSIDPGYDLIV